MKLLRIIYWSLIGELLKLLIRCGVWRPRYAVDGRHGTGCVTVSMTSYGRRVATLPYTLVSVLRQTQRPDAIVVWLDDSWSDETLPKWLASYRRYGVEILYCKDLRSYKKLIPTLQRFPEDSVITVDDDLYCNSHMVEWLTQRDAADVLCVMRSHAPRADHQLMPYETWDKETHLSQGLTLFPTSGAGTLYSKTKLHEDTCREELFMKLSPKADDVWLYFMTVLKHLRVVNVAGNHWPYIPLDNFYQLTHRGSRLADDNCGESMNDKQIREVMQHYGLTVEDLKV